MKSIGFDPKKEFIVPDVPHFRNVTGDFTYTISKPKTVDLKVFDGEEKLITTLVDHQEQAAGTHTFKYTAEIPINDDAHLPAVIIRFYLNGELFAARKHVLSK